MVKKLKLHEDGQLSHHRVDDRLEPALRHLGSGSLPSMAEETANAFGSKRLQLRTYDHD
jgi:hypothetical protein